MLIFYLVEKSTFHVLHYSKKPRTNIRHFEELSSEDEVENVEEKEDEEENVEASRKSKKVKTEPKESSGKCSIHFFMHFGSYFVYKL